MENRSCNEFGHLFQVVIKAGEQPLIFCQKCGEVRKLEIPETVAP